VAQYLPMIQCKIPLFHRRRHLQCKQKSSHIS
jgi:hypothetical protein